MISHYKLFLNEIRKAYNFISSENYVACYETHENFKRNSMFYQLKEQCDENESDCVSNTCNYTINFALQQNIIISKFLNNKKNVKSSEQEKYAVQLHDEISKIQCSPVIKEHLVIEFACLYNYLSHIISIPNYQKFSSETWSFIIKMLQKACRATNNRHLLSASLLLDVEICLENIIYKELSVNSLEILYRLFMVIGWLAMLHMANTIYFAIIKALSKIHYLFEKLFIEQDCIELLFPGNNFTKPNLMQLHNFMMCCSKYKDRNLDKALYHLKKVSYSEWAGSVKYMEAYIFYKKRNLPSAIEACLITWKKNNSMPNELVAKACNLISCCYFIQNNFEEALKWLSEAIKMNERSFIYLYNLSQIQKKSNKPSELENTFKQLINGECFLTWSTHFVYSLLQEPKHKILNIEPTYLLAHQYLLNGKYKDAVLQFSKLIRNNRMFSVISESNFAEKLRFIYRWYLEAAYIHMQLEQFYECEELCLLTDDLVPWCDYDIVLWNQKDDVKSNDMKEYTDITRSCEIVTDDKLCDFEKQQRYQFDVYECKLLDVIKLLIKAFVSLNCIDVTTALPTLNQASKLLNKVVNEKVDAQTQQRPKGMLKNSSNYLQYKWADPTATFRKHSISSTTDDNCGTNKQDILLSQNYDHQVKFLFADMVFNLTKERLLFSHIFNNMALISLIYGNINEADNYLKLCLDADPDNLDGLYNFCLFELKKGNFEVADSLWKSFKNRSSLISDIISKMQCPLPYSVSVRQLKTLDSVLSYASNDESFMDFDVNWN